MGSGVIALIDFEDYTAGAVLQGQGMSPYIWSAHGGGGGAQAAGTRWDIVDNGAPSGNVARRTTTSTTGTGGVAQIILQSGIAPGTYDKIAYEFDFYSEQDGSRHDFACVLRSSGVVWNNRRAINCGYVQTDAGTNNNIFLNAIEAGGTLVSYNYLIPVGDFTNGLKFRIIDDLENARVQVWVNASGSYEFIHDESMPYFLDHNSSGAFYARNLGGTQKVIIDNLTITGFGSGFPDPSTEISSSIGGYISAVGATIYGNDEVVQACWKLDEIGDNDFRSDLSGKGNHLETILGNPTQITGKRDNATRFVHWQDPFPSLQLTSSGVSAGMSPTTENWSAGGWIKPSGSVLESYATIFGKSGFDQYVLYLDDQLQLWGQVKIDGIGYIVTTSPSSVVLNQWQHIDWVVDRASGIQYIYHTNEACETTLIGSGILPSDSKVQDQDTGPIHFGTLPNGQNPLDADIDEWFFIQQTLLLADINSICALGLPLRDLNGASGQVGGYMDAVASGAVTVESGQIGGYIQAIATQQSGTVGGYIEQTSVETPQSGQIGGYILYSADSMSGQIGGLMYAVPVLRSGQIGGHIEGFTDASGTYLSYFDFLNVETNDWDAVLRIGAGESLSFDAVISVARAFTPPTVTCFITNSGTPGGDHFITFSGTVAVGDQTLPNGGDNSIDSAWIQFGDFSGAQGLSISDNTFFEGSHTFTASGVYIVRVDVIDKNGVHGSCSKRIDLSVGLPAAQIITMELTAAVPSGSVPHTVAFSNNFAVQPVGIKEKVINFGDRTITHLDNPVHVYKFVGDYIPVWTVKDDNGRFWNDSLEVGVNK